MEQIVIVMIIDQAFRKERLDLEGERDDSEQGELHWYLINRITSAAINSNGVNCEWERER